MARGALKNHKQLSDKVHFSIQCRTVNLTTLRSRLDNIVRLALYRNDYANCPPQSRCKNNQNYEPSNLIITNNFSVTPFTGFGVYKAPKDFLHVLDTYYVDSFNNVLNMFHDKCTQLRDDSYNMRTGLAICHWNENVDRHSTGLYQFATVKTKKILGPRTFTYREDIWRHFIHALAE